MQTRQSGTPPRESSRRGSAHDALVATYWVPWWRPPAPPDLSVAQRDGAAPHWQGVTQLCDLWRNPGARRPNLWAPSQRQIAASRGHTGRTGHYWASFKELLAVLCFSPRSCLARSAVASLMLSLYSPRGGWEPRVSVLSRRMFL